MMFQKSLVTIEIPKHPSQNTFSDTRSKKCDEKIMDHRIMYGRNNAHRTSYSQDGNEEISKAAIIYLSLQTTTMFHADC